MFIGVCIECYDGEQGKIEEINRVDEDDPICEICGGPKHLVYTDRGLGIPDGDYSHVSASLAISPSQTKVHRKLFPKVEVLPDGQLHFKSVKTQSDYLKQTGFDKKPQKIRKKGVTIA